MRCIVPIVEGPGDVEAAPVLLRKILFEHLGSHDIAVAKPKKAGGRSALDRAGGVEKFVEYARHYSRLWCGLSVGRCG